MPGLKREALMLEMPVGYSVDDFLQAHRFLYRMLLGNNRRIVFRTESPYSSQAEGEYKELSLSERWETAYYFELLNEFDNHNHCQHAFIDFLAACEGNSANITEFTYIKQYPKKKNPHNYKVTTFRSIGATAHAAGFRYISQLGFMLERKGDLYLCPQTCTPNIDRLRENIEEIIETARPLILESDDMHRLMCRLRRETAILVRHCSDSPSTKTVTADQIRNLISNQRRASGKRTNNKDYAKSWMSKYVQDWPKPIQEHSGSSPAEWNLTDLIPVLKDQFSDIAWDNF